VVYLTTVKCGATVQGHGHNKSPLCLNDKIGTSSFQ
jgi:hypothetical protein